MSEHGVVVGDPVKVSATVEQVRDERARMEQIAVAGLAWWHEGFIERKPFILNGRHILDVVKIGYGYLMSVHLDASDDEDADPAQEGAG